MKCIISVKRALLLVGLCLGFLSCEKILGISPSENGAVAVFDEMWQEMDRRYSLFGIKKVDWDAEYVKYRDRINEGMPDKELFKVMAEMQETLKDGHVALISGIDTSGYDSFYSLYPVNFNYNNIQANYLGTDYKTTGPFVYKIVDNIGYIYYSSFNSSFTDIELEKLIQDMSVTKGFILDIRSNTGGSSTNVDRLAQCFLSDRKLVKYEKRKSGPGHMDFSDPVPYYLQPGKVIYNKPVIVLTNRTCFSACNDFALYLSELPNVQLYGDQTGGGGAIPNNYILANGWKIQYSSTITLSPGKESIENGIQPDVRITISGLEESRGIDPIIDRSFLALK
jgi:hypothetical protein